MRESPDEVRFAQCPVAGRFRHARGGGRAFQYLIGLVHHPVHIVPAIGNAALPARNVEVFDVIALGAHASRHYIVTGVLHPEQVTTPGVFGTHPLVHRRHSAVQVVFAFPEKSGCGFPVGLGVYPFFVAGTQEEYQPHQ